MKKPTPAKGIILGFLLALASLCAGCSYTTEFVVINESGNPIEVRYRLKDFPGPFAPRIAPATMTTGQLRAGDQLWSQLSAAQFRLEPDERRVVVRVMPNQSLRVERMHRAGMQVDETDEAKVFSIEEMIILGANNEIKLQGEQVRKSFVPESKRVYALIFR